MKVEIKVPVMGESITQATVGTILKVSGSLVAADDEILELETDKVNQVVYAPKAGVLTVQVQEGQVLAIAEVIGFIDTEQAAAAVAQTPAPAPAASVAQAPTPPQAAEPRKEEGSKSKDLKKDKAPKGEAAEAASAAAVPSGGQKDIRFGKESFFQEVRNKGAAPQGAPSSAEPQEGAASVPASQSSSASARPETRRRMTTIRKVIAQRLVEAKNSTAMLTTFNEVDLTEVMALRERYREAFTKKHGVRLGFMSFFIKAAVYGMQQVPEVNSYIDGDQIVHREYYDIGVAVGTDRGLIVPVIRECDKLSFPAIEGAIEGYAVKARDGSLAVADLQGGGFTITNGGVYGSLLSTPILNPPQCGILGMHKIQKRAVVVNDAIVIRPMMYLALSYDHRVVDGKEAVTFLIQVKNALEDPARLLLEI